jgi:hypothetical protein
MPILVKNPNPGSLASFTIIELQGDLESRYDEIQDCSGAFVGDLLYNKFGHPVSIFFCLHQKQE